MFKGDLVDSEVVTSTAMDGASCGTSFGLEERWIVFATVTEGDLWTGLCSGNVLLTGGEDEQGLIDQLGPPVVSPGGSDTVPSAEPFAVPMAVLVVGGVAVLVAGVSAWAFVIEPRRRVS